MLFLDQLNDFMCHILELQRSNMVICNKGNYKYIIYETLSAITRTVMMHQDEIYALDSVSFGDHPNISEYR